MMASGDIYQAYHSTFGMMDLLLMMKNNSKTELSRIKFFM